MKKTMTIARIIITDKTVLLILGWLAALACCIAAVVQSCRVNALASEIEALTPAAVKSVAAPAAVSEQKEQEPPQLGTLYSLPENAAYDGKKSYESYTTITDTTSPQYAIQMMAWTNEDAFRMVGDRYLVAVGTYFNAPCGTSIDVILENGTVIPCIVGDIKADAHTDSWNVYSANGCATEFIVDAGKTRANITGDVSDLYESWQAKVTAVRVYDGISCV